MKRSAPICWPSRGGRRGRGAAPHATV